MIPFVRETQDSYLHNEEMRIHWLCLWGSVWGNGEVLASAVTAAQQCECSQYSELHDMHYTAKWTKE